MALFRPKSRHLEHSLWIAHSRDGHCAMEGNLIHIDPEGVGLDLYLVGAVLHDKPALAFLDHLAFDDERNVRSLDLFYFVQLSLVRLIAEHDSLACAARY